MMFVIVFLSEKIVLFQDIFGTILFTKTFVGVATFMSFPMLF